MSDLLDVVTSNPGRTPAWVAGALKRRRAVALELVAAAIAADAVHQGESTVSIRGGAERTVLGLFPGPPPALFAEPALSGEQLRRTRLQAGLTVGGLAHELGVSIAQLRRWETGQQSVPTRVRTRVPAAIEAGQQAAHAQLERAATRPRRRTDARRYRDLLERIAEGPGRSRYALVGSRSIDARLLEHAIASGQAHEAPSWTERSRQPVVGVFPGSAPTAEAPVQVAIAAIADARRAAGWSQDRVADRLGIARTTWARWERGLELVPGWASPVAGEVLEEAQAAAATRRGHEDELVAAAEARPGLSPKALKAAMGYSRPGRWFADALAAAVAAGRVHERHAGRRGQRGGIFPGPAPAEVLSAAQLRTLRERAGLTQRELAAAVGTHVQAVRDWEGTKRPLSAPWQAQLREYLEAQPDVLERLRLEVLAALPATRHQLDLRFPGKGQALTDALEVLVSDGRAVRGRVGAGRPGQSGPTRGRVGFLPA